MAKQVEETSAEKPKTLEERLNGLARDKGLTVAVSTFSQVQDWDLVGRNVVLLKRRFGKDVVMLSTGMAAELLGNEPRIDTPATWTTMKVGQLFIGELLANAHVESVRVQYMREDIAVLTDLEFLLGRNMC